MANVPFCRRVLVIWRMACSGTSCSARIPNLANDGSLAVSDRLPNQGYVHTIARLYDSLACEVEPEEMLHSLDEDHGERQRCAERTEKSAGR